MVFVVDADSAEAVKRLQDDPKTAPLFPPIDGNLGQLVTLTASGMPHYWFRLPGDSPPEGWTQVNAQSRPSALLGPDVDTRIGPQTDKHGALLRGKGGGQALGPGSRMWAYKDNQLDLPKGGKYRAVGALHLPTWPEDLLPSLMATATGRKTSPTGAGGSQSGGKRRKALMGALIEVAAYADPGENGYPDDFDQFTLADADPPFPPAFEAEAHRLDEAHQREGGWEHPLANTPGKDYDFPGLVAWAWKKGRENEGTIRSFQGVSPWKDRADASTGARLILNLREIGDRILAADDGTMANPCSRLERENGNG